MFRKLSILAAVVAALALTVSVVTAGNAHFVGAPSLTVSGNTSACPGRWPDSATFRRSMSR